MTRLDEVLGFHEAALRVRAQRQEVIASNIANADTPNYKSKDLDFASAMREVLGSNAGLTKTSAGHLSSAGHSLPNARAAERRVVGRDGNGVDVDRERAAFTENALRYEASVNMINGQVKRLLSVIQG